jgi:hypothetical protein
LKSPHLVHAKNRRVVLSSVNLQLDHGPNDQSGVEAGEFIPIVSGRPHGEGAACGTFFISPDGRTNGGMPRGARLAPFATLFKAFERVGIFADAEHQRGGLGVGLGAAKTMLVPLSSRAGIAAHRSVMFFLRGSDRPLGSLKFLRIQLPKDGLLAGT